MTVNRRTPGPSIEVKRAFATKHFFANFPPVYGPVEIHNDKFFLLQVCEGDNIVVNVTNHLRNGEATSIHWHGFHVRNEQYMDGVGMLTQCPIPVGDSFTYKITGTLSSEIVLKNVLLEACRLFTN